MINEILALSDKAILGLKNNPTVWIAEGQSRFSTNWKNKKISWAELLGRLQKPTITQETQAEYLKMSKSQQDAIKDVGGFVGGTLKGGRRKSDTVELRSMLCFDFDHAPNDLQVNLTLEAPYAWALYSTHKHKPDAPRLRLIVPLDRDVSPEEYEAIMRKMCEVYGMQYLDSTTCQPSRLMYWPSASRDAEYIFDYNDEPSLKADEILAEYPDWKDCSYWPVFPDEVKERKKRVEKQQDPATKKGLVGAFCKTYDVPAAIDAFLSDVYTATEKSDRYTYAAGSTFGGLVVYDDGAFCYSNHSTDPAHGMDLNAFDLVRVHKFGDLDADAKENTPTTKLASYQAMLDMIRSDEACIRTIDAEREAQALADFEGEEATDTAATPQKESRDWMSKLTRNKKGEIESTFNNVLRIFKHDPKLRGLKYNEFSRWIEITSPVPWSSSGSTWTDMDESGLYAYLATNYAEFKRTDVQDVLKTVAHHRSFHPVRDYLRSLPEWDGVLRADRIFVDYLGASDTEYTRTCTHKWLLAAVARAEIPGAKFDYVPVLSGPPGIGKSTLVSRLGAGWFSDSLSFEDMKDKTSAEKIQGVWINEIPELKGMRKMEVESIKSFISRTEDVYRPAFGRVVEYRKRGCVFVGTSNSDDFLKDNTGNRRFWPIPCSKAHRLNAWSMTKEELEQIWAEVWFYWDSLEERDLTLPHELGEIAESMQTSALEQDERAGIVGMYLDRLLPYNWADKDLIDRRNWLDSNEAGTELREVVSVMEIWAECFRMPPQQRKRSDSDDIVRIMLQLGWVRDGKRTIRTKLYGVQNAYVRTAKMKIKW